MAVCKTCGETKPSSDFPVAPRMLTGHDSTCRVCRSAQRAERRKSPATAAQDYEARRRYEASQRAAETRRRYRKESDVAKQKKRRYTERFNERYPEKRRAYYEVWRAVNRGALVREPCLFCGDENVEGHHHDYSQPLAVTWLCPTHHRVAHGRERVAA